MSEEIKLEDSERTRCEIWTRVMGYHRPVSQFNIGKQTEHKMRKHFTEPGQEAQPSPAQPQPHQTSPTQG